MSECDFASSNAEKFMEKLQDELLYLDTVVYILRIKYYSQIYWKTYLKSSPTLKA